MVNYSNQNPYICSPMNYVGGKYKLLPQILPLFPKQINTFVDLFCGGCNVGINVSAETIIFNDNLSYLIDLYTVFNTRTNEEILNHIENRIEQYNLTLTNEFGYKALRILYNEERNPLDLFVLVAYSFNHQIRFNNSHEFNNPFGRNRSGYNPRMQRNLILFLNQLRSKNTFFSCCDFDKFDYSALSKNDFVYCDPPYLITTGTYNDGKRGFTGWDDNQEIKLLSLLDDLNRNGVRFALSNVLVHKGRNNSILQEWLYEKNYHVFHLKMDYSNSNYQTIMKSRESTDEILITNYNSERQLELRFD